MNIRRTKTIEPVNTLKPVKPKKTIKINLSKEVWTFIVLAFILSCFFIGMLVLLLTGFHAVDSGWLYNGGL